MSKDLYLFKYINLRDSTYNDIDLTFVISRQKNNILVMVKLKKKLEINVLFELIAF